MALQILLDENHLSVDDQQKALRNIKDNYEALQVCDLLVSSASHSAFYRGDKMLGTLAEKCRFGLIW